MIPIRKGSAPPDLVRRGEEHVRELCAAYESGDRSLKARRSIYASAAVKAALEACHYGKCCYCETHIRKPHAYGNVEHWRPQSSCRQSFTEERIRPGYYWLAYSWDNLLWSCCFCNSENKNDLFPLENPARRARHHGMSLEEEIPAILKPDGNEDPRDHITFHGEVPVGRTALGRKTIAVLGLDLEAHEPRRTHLKAIMDARERYINLMKSADPIARRWAERDRQFLQEAVRPEQPYSAMVAVYLEANPLSDPSCLIP